MVLEGVGLSIQGKEGDVARNSEDASGSNTTIRGCTINGGYAGFASTVFPSTLTAPLQLEKIKIPSAPLFLREWAARDPDLPFR